MHYTMNDLDPVMRGKVVEILNQRVADSVDLTLQAKQAHWNVKGPSFVELHQLFDMVSETIESYLDLLAERVAQLGGQVLGTVRVAAVRSAIPEYPLDILKGADHVAALCAALSIFARDTRRT